MVDKLYIKTILQLTLLSLNLLFAIAYSLSILLIRRCHNRNNMFILNICFTIISTSVFFAIFFDLQYFDRSRLLDPRMCILLGYVFHIASIEVPFAFVAFSIHRFCSIIYSAKPFFKTKRWVVICIASQWVVVCVVSLPYVFRKEPLCSYQLWMLIYTCVFTVCVPLLINVVLNVLIFNHVRNSTRRVRPQIVNTLTNRNNIQPARLNQRDTSMLRQMIFMFLMFIGGWTPVFASLIISQFINFDPLVTPMTVLFGELCLMSININLFIHNHVLKQYLLNKIRQFFRR